MGRGPVRLYAWAHAMSPAEIAEAASRFPGLGVVLYGSNYAAAPQLAVPPIAYIGNLSQAKEVAKLGNAGTNWAFAILSDERNITGLSGKREEPHEYMTRFEPARRVLADAGIRTSSAGLGMLGSPLIGRYDHEYTRALAGWTDQAGVNLNPLQYRAAMRGIRQHDSKFFVTLIPQRMSWRPHNTILSGFMQQYLACPPQRTQYARLLRDPQVAGVGVWCLREVVYRDGTSQAHHGLLDRSGRVTSVGRLIMACLTEMGT